jgi:hypothetical protein
VIGVFGLSIRTQERDLDDEFSRFGRVEKVTIVYDQRVSSHFSSRVPCRVVVWRAALLVGESLVFRWCVAQARLVARAVSCLETLHQGSRPVTCASGSRSYRILSIRDTVAGRSIGIFLLYYPPISYHGLLNLSTDTLH